MNKESIIKLDSIFERIQKLQPRDNIDFKCGCNIQCEKTNGKRMWYFYSMGGVKKIGYISEDDPDFESKVLRYLFY